VDEDAVKDFAKHRRVDDSTFLTETQQAFKGSCSAHVLLGLTQHL